MTFALSLLCALGCALACAAPGGKPGSGGLMGEVADPVETEEAIALLTRMSGFLASQPALRFEAKIEYDTVQTSGQKLEFGSKRSVTLLRPHRARVEETHRDGAQEILTFDGRRLSMALPEQRVYSSIKYEGSVGAAFEHLSAEYGVATPLSDLLREDLPEFVATRAQSGRRLDPAMIEGIACEHLAFRGERVDFQLFIQQGETPVPVRFIIDHHAEPGAPQFRAQLSSWEFESSLPKSAFYFVPQAGSQRVSHAELLNLLLGALEPWRDDQ